MNKNNNTVISSFAIQRLSQAERWLAEAKTLDDLKQIHDIAIAAQAYAEAHRLGLEAVNHAMEIRLVAARRMGELCPPVPPKKSGSMAHKKEVPESRAPAFPESQRLSEFRKLAEIPLPEFKERLNAIKEREEKITYTKLLSPEKPHISHASGENEWYTPSDIIEAARQVMGSIDCDPASTEQANKAIKAKQFYNAEQNGLTKKWHGNIWLNPPYAQPLIEQFAETITSKYESGEINQASILVNNATETSWFQRILSIADAICFFRGRIKFIDKNGEPTGAPLQGQALIYFGNQKEKFRSAFADRGIILDGPRKNKK